MHAEAFVFQSKYAIDPHAHGCIPDIFLVPLKETASWMVFFSGWDELMNPGFGPPTPCLTPCVARSLSQRSMPRIPWLEDEERAAAALALRTAEQRRAREAPRGPGDPGGPGDVCARAKASFDFVCVCVCVFFLGGVGP